MLSAQVHEFLEAYKRSVSHLEGPFHLHVIKVDTSNANRNQ